MVPFLLRSSLPSHLQAALHLQMIRLRRRKIRFRHLPALRGRSAHSHVLLSFLLLLCWYRHYRLYLRCRSERSRSYVYQIFLILLQILSYYIRKHLIPQTENLYRTLLSSEIPWSPLNRWSNHLWSQRSCLRQDIKKQLILNFLYRESVLSPLL